MSVEGTSLEDHFGFFKRRDVIKNWMAEVKKNPKISVHIGQKVTKITQNETSATIEIEGKEEKTFKAVICGDGIHSLGKRTIFSNTDDIIKPVHSGFCLFYGLFKKFPKAMTHGGSM